MTKSTTIPKKTREEIINQVQEEITFAREYKRFRISQWHLNESLAYHKKKTFTDVRANVGVAYTKAQGFVQTLLSKIDSAPNIKFTRGAEADLVPAKRMNALFAQDMKQGGENLSFKDLLGKKEAIIYGRITFEFHASSIKNYKANLSYVSPYDFLIDPSAGGEDIEKAYYLGRGGVWKTKKDLEKGKKAGKYIQTEVKKILEGDGDDASTSEEEKEKENARVYIAGEGNRIFKRKGMYRFWEWYTTYEGERYYVLYNEDSKIGIRVEKMKNIFKSELYPFWTWATDPDFKEFWSLAPLDQVREIFMAQGVSIDQLLDNAEAINRPMKGVVSGSVKNPAQLKYGRDKVVPFKKGITNIKDAVYEFKTAELKTPIEVYNTLENIGNVESGVNAASKGVAEEDKVGIYEGNLANVSDRLGLLNKSYADGYHRFAILYYNGIKEHLTKKMAVRMIGADGVETEELVSKKDVIGKRDFDVMVEASDAEIQSSIQDQKNKLAFLAAQHNNPNVNQRVLLEMEAEISGVDPKDVQRLMDVSEFGDAELMSEAARDIERILNGEDVKPNKNANNAYRQKVVDYMRDNEEHIDDKTWKKLEEYAESLTPIVTRNMIRKAKEQRALSGQLMIDEARGISTHEIPNELPQQVQ